MEPEQRDKPVQTSAQQPQHQKPRFRFAEYIGYVVCSAMGAMIFWLIFLFGKGAC